MAVLWCHLSWYFLVLMLHLVPCERSLVILRLACKLGCFAACSAAFAALLLGITSMFVRWPFVLAGGACVPGAVDASALFRPVAVFASLCSVHCAVSAHILAKVLSILSISDCPSELIIKAAEIMSWYCCLSCCMLGIGQVCRFSQQSKGCFQRCYPYCHIPQFRVSVCSFCVHILYVQLPAALYQRMS